MDIKNKHIIAIDFVLIVGSLLIIAGLAGYSRPLVIAPINNFTTTETSILFSFNRADLILIDDNLDFTSPEKIYVKDNLVINLKPGVYYWKVQGALESPVREFTIKSEVSLKLVEKNESVDVVNSGNTRLNVDIYKNGGLTGNVVLGVNEQKEVNGTQFIGSEFSNSSTTERSLDNGRWNNG